MQDNNPFGYSLLTYIWVLGIGCVGGAIRHLNRMRTFRLGAFFIDMMSASFTSLIAFWLCEAGGVDRTLSAALIGISGLMGSRAWKEFEDLLRLKLGLPPAGREYDDYYDDPMPRYEGRRGNRTSNPAQLKQEPPTPPMSTDELSVSGGEEQK